MAVTQPISTYRLDRMLRAVSRGDRDALAQLYHATAAAVYAYALSILRNRFDAEDVLQECYVTIFRSAGQYRSQDKPMAWIMTITRNLCLKLARSQQRYIPLESEDLIGTTPVSPDDRLLLQSCMKLLSNEEHQIVVLHAVAGFTHREIGLHLGLKTSTVLSKYHRALQKLRSAI